MGYHKCSRVLIVIRFAGPHQLKTIDMKNYFFTGILCMAIVFIISCNQQSIVKFRNPQPAGSENLKALPSRLTGNYLNEDVSVLVTVSPQQILSRYESDFAEHKDSVLQYFEIAGDSIADKETGLKYHYTLKGDTISWRHTLPFDTIFSMNKGGVLRKFRGYYFLNMPADSGYWNVQKLNVSKGRLTISEIADSADIANLQKIMETPGDSIYTFNPTQKQFKKYVKQNGFNTEHMFYKTKQ